MANSPTYSLPTTTVTAPRNALVSPQYPDASLYQKFLAPQQPTPSMPTDDMLEAYLASLPIEQQGAIRAHLSSLRTQQALAGAPALGTSQPPTSGTPSWPWGR